MYCFNIWKENINDTINSKSLQIDVKIEEKRNVNIQMNTICIRIQSILLDYNAP